MSKTYFAFDIESTGKDIYTDAPMQFGWSVYKYEDIEYKVESVYVNPERPCNPEAMEVHHITDEVAANGISLDQLADLIEDIFKKNKIDYIVGINVLNFDIPMLINSLKQKGRDVSFLNEYEIEDPQAWYLAETHFKLPRPKRKVDYQRIAAKFKPKGTKSNLSYLCQINNIPLSNAHDAKEDITATINLWKKMKEPEMEKEAGIRIWADKESMDLNVFIPGNKPIKISLEKIYEMFSE